VDIVGMVEIADRLGVARQTPRQWQQRKLLPAPDAVVSWDIPVWRWATIEKWAKETGRMATEHRESND
jgi:hypothetical protein